MPTTSIGTKPTTTISPTLKPGSVGPEVRKVQQELAALGFLSEKNVTGTYDAATQAAVLRFRKSRKELADQGVATDKVQDSLSQLAKAWRNQMPLRRRHLGSKAEVLAERKQDDRTADVIAKKQGLGFGDKGNAVLNLEKELKASGFDIGKADGKYGMRTAAAVRAFQHAKGLKETGEVNGQTWAQLRKSSFVARTTTSVPQSVGEKSQAVLHTEQMLKKLGYKGIVVDGTFGTHAEDAVKAFQKKNHLEVTGAVDGKTLEAMKKQLGGTPAGVQKFIDIALAQRGDPYVFGAEGPNAFDCSGLIYYALNHAGVKVPRLTAAGYQNLYANSKVDRAHLKPGDLVFYYYPNTRGIPPGHASHIEIYLGHGMTMGTDNPSEGARVEPIDWNAFIGGARVKKLQS